MKSPPAAVKKPSRVAPICAELPATDSSPQNPQIGALLLAAGNSTRMGGDNKLLLPWHGAPLILHAARTLADAVRCGIVRRAVAVCGRDSEKIIGALAQTNLPCAVNPAYQTGIASSLICGLQALRAEELDGVLVMLGDMPRVSVADIRAVAAAFAASGDIIAPICDGRRGNPVLIGRRHFAALMCLRGDTGARALFVAHPVLETAAGAGVLFDIDSPQDIKNAADAPPQ